MKGFLHASNPIRRSCFERPHRCNQRQPDTVQPIAGVFCSTLPWRAALPSSPSRNTGIASGASPHSAESCRDGNKDKRAERHSLLPLSFPELLTGTWERPDRTRSGHGEAVSTVAGMPWRSRRIVARVPCPITQRGTGRREIFRSDDNRATCLRAPIKSIELDAADRQPGLADRQSRPARSMCTFSGGGMRPTAAHSTPGYPCRQPGSAGLPHFLA